MNSLFEKIFLSVFLKSLNGWVVSVAKIGGFFNQTRSSLPVTINSDQTIATTATPTKTVVLTFVPPPSRLGKQCPEASFWVCLIEKNNNNSNKLMTMMVMMICRYFCSVRTVDLSMWTLSVWLPDWLAGWWCCCCCFVCHCKTGQRCSKRKFFFEPGKLCFSFFSFRLLHQQQQQQQLITSNSGGPIAVPSPLLAQFAQLLSVCLSV